MLSICNDYESYGLDRVECIVELLAALGSLEYRSLNVGLFPASFVTGDLSAVVESSSSASASAGVAQQQSASAAAVAVEPAGPVAPEKARIERCLELLNNEDPTDVASPHPEELDRLECTYECSFSCEYESCTKLQVQCFFLTHHTPRTRSSRRSHGNDGGVRDECGGRMGRRTARTGRGVPTRDAAVRAGHRGTAAAAAAATRSQIRLSVAHVGAQRIRLRATRDILCAGSGRGGGRNTSNGLGSGADAAALCRPLYCSRWLFASTAGCGRFRLTVSRPLSLRLLRMARAGCERAYCRSRICFPTGAHRSATLIQSVHLVATERWRAALCASPITTTLSSLLPNRHIFVLIPFLCMRFIYVLNSSLISMLFHSSHYSLNLLLKARSLSFSTIAFWQIKLSNCSVSFRSRVFHILVPISLYTRTLHTSIRVSYVSIKNLVFTNWYEINLHTMYEYISVYCIILKHNKVYSYNSRYYIGIYTHKTYELKSLYCHIQCMYPHICTVH